MGPTAAMLMHGVSILLAVSGVSATTGSLEMDSHAQQNSWSVGLDTDHWARNAWVSYYLITLNCPQLPWSI